MSVSLRDTSHIDSDAQEVHVKGIRRDKSGKETTFEFIRGKLLGKGAFAKCFEMKSKSDVFAGKLIEKDAIKTESAKQKLIFEIKNHSCLKHPNVVRFHNYFEDEKFYYIILEMCNQKTLRSLLKRRKTISEVETRFYLRQILDAVQHMHSKLIIHRDLKLDNIFLKEMVVKIGDFGLSVKLEHPNEKKTALCGTPNYISPEVLAKTGHSFEVDIWAVGVIMYSLIIGTPPFETSKVSETYQRIRDNNYSFPPDSPISPEAKDLIVKLLHPEPYKRPTIPQILDHPFFADYIPSALPEYSLTTSPMNEYEARGRLTPIKPDKAKKYISNSRPLLVKMDNTRNIKVGQSGASSVAAGKISGAKRANEITNDNPAKRLCVRSQTTPNTKQDVTTATNSNNNNNGSSKEFTYSIYHPLLQHIAQFLERSKHLQKNEDIASALQSNILLDEIPTWVSKWVDYSQRYGLGYVMRDGTLGVVFNDRSNISLPTDIPMMHVFEKADTRKPLKIPTMMNQSDNVNKDYNARIQKRLKLLTHFKDYLGLCHAVSSTTTQR
eukprot:TRINITY_DN5067_c0_g1_i1.p1 TRINITY_DN5067_c0_g1~~TRINITY_DN5067_c0_g1_i1.p1  ORF type:complete len:551 (-),score=71.04 TRINITY_DN5067_c0_g1_i1:806-2458(-)